MNFYIELFLQDICLGGAVAAPWFIDISCLRRKKVNYLLIILKADVGIYTRLLVRICATKERNIDFKSNGYVTCMFNLLGSIIFAC